MSTTKQKTSSGKSPSKAAPAEKPHQQPPTPLSSPDEGVVVGEGEIGRGGDRETEKIDSPPSLPDSGLRFYRDLCEARIDIEEISAFEHQPREDFDPAKLQDLADSIKTHGQLQNATVRKKGAWYELISGERRMRAVLLAGLTHLNCRVVECDDKTAIELCIDENRLREDFNPIEEARGFKKLIEGAGHNQDSIAKLLKVHPSWVSNRLRLLRLPEAWQRRVIARDLPGTHARALVPWAERPSVLAELEAEFSSRKFSDVTVRSFETSICNAVYKLTRCADPTAVGQGPKFEITDAIREELDIVNAPPYAGADETYPRAFNIELWERLNKEASEALKASRRSEADNDTAGTESDHVDGGGDAGSANAKSAAVRDESLSELTPHAVNVHFVRCLAPAIVDKLRPDETAIRLFMTLVGTCGENESAMAVMANALGAGLDEMPEEIDAYMAMAGLHPSNFPTVALKVVTEFLTHDPERHFSLPLLLLVARDLRINPVAKWRPTDELLELCSTSQLRELFTDEMADAKKLAKWGRERLLKELMEHWPDGYLPILLKPEELSDE